VDSDAERPSGCEASDAVPGAWVLPEADSSRPAFRHGQARIQDEASQLVAFLAPVQAGSVVWDACAAPGGKTITISERLGGAARIVATDRSLARARRLSQTLLRYDAPAAVAVVDARESAPFRCSFDCVLLDVPCSGLGTLRRNPEIRWRFEPERFRELQQAQSRILRSAAASVRRGGCLLYSTCSTEPEENEEVVEGFLKKTAGFHIVRPVAPPGVERWLDQRGYLRTFPSTRTWDGFFAALVVRE
jgi:16S rRNA (cytosine967-C5)-methyltransferase